MAGQPETVGFVSLNVCCGLSSPLRPVRSRAVEFCRRIERSDAGVVNFQEVWSPGLFRLIRAHLPSFAFVASRTGTAGQPAGGLVTFSRLPLRSVSYVSFRGARAHAGSRRFRGASVVNSRLKGVLTYELANRRTVVGNVHLTANRDGDWSTTSRYHELQRAQLRIFQQIMRRVRRADTELLVATGDFNLASTSSLYPLLVDGGWCDPFAAADAPTYQPALLPDGKTAQRIDYVLVAGDGAHSAVTETDLLFGEAAPLPGGPGFLSDHLAPFARIEVPRV